VAIGRVEKRAVRPHAPEPVRNGTVEKESIVKWIKRIVVTLVVIFALFYLFTRPTDAADAVRSAFAAVGAGFGSVITFLTSLTE
jgi:Na+/proline symporter